MLKRNDIEKYLIGKCRKGDKQAQFKIYRKYYNAMYNTSLRIIGNPQDAEDVMQEAFLSAFEHLYDFTGKVSFGAWLKKIIVNRSLDMLKSRHITFDEISDIAEPIAGNVTEEQDLSVQKIHKAMKLLPEKYRVIFSLYLFEGYDHAEIGKILNIKESSSRSQYTRAKQQLINLMKKM